MTLAASLVLGACGGGGDGGGGPALALPECAGGLPVPDAVEVVEITATPEAGNPTCAVTFASDEAVDAVAASWRETLDAAGVGYTEQLVAGRSATLHLEGLICGSIVVFAAGTDRVTDAVEADRTPALASVIAC